VIGAAFALMMLETSSASLGSYMECAVTPAAGKEEAAAAAGGPRTARPWKMDIHGVLEHAERMQVDEGLLGTHLSEIQYVHDGITSAFMGVAVPDGMVLLYLDLDMKHYDPLQDSPILSGKYVLTDHKAAIHSFAIVGKCHEMITLQQPGKKS
jgi:hypothetical protein